MRMLRSTKSTSRMRKNLVVVADLQGRQAIECKGDSTQYTTCTFVLLVLVFLWMFVSNHSSYHLSQPLKHFFRTSSWSYTFLVNLPSVRASRSKKSTRGTPSS